MLRAAARAYGRRGIPVFPLVPGGKKPIIPKCRDARGLSGEELACHARGCSRMGHGLYDATTDEDQITEWWTQYPGANIGIPTGARSGLLVLDVDPDDGGDGSLAALIAEHGPIPATATVRTGRGGTHSYLRYPADTEIRNSAGRLGPGIDVRGEGGYIVAPPSVTVGPYEWMDRRPVADAPEWIAAALRRQPRAAGGASGDGSGGPVAPSVDLDGPPIPEGTRNDTLVAIAGRLHDGTRGVAAMESYLAATNAARCQPPLPEAEVRGIAQRIEGWEPCRAGTPAPDAETRAMIDGFTGRMMARAWSYPGGKSDRSVCRALTKLSRRHGVAIPVGVRVVVSLLDLADAAGVSHVTVIKAVRRLRLAGIIRKDDAGRRGPQAGAYVLLTDSANLYHSVHSGSLDQPGDANGKPLRSTEPAPLTAPGLRHSAPVFDGPNRVGTIRRPGPGGLEGIDHLEAAGGTMPLSSFAAAINASRPRDLRRPGRVLSRLETAGVVEFFGDTVSLTSGWMAALERERIIGGEIEAQERDRARYARKREAFKAAWARGEVVGRDELRRRRERRAEMGETPPRPAPVAPARSAPAADGVVGELERLPMGEPPAAPARSGPTRPPEPIPETPTPRPDPADPPPPTPPWAALLRDLMVRYPYRASHKVSPRERAGYASATLRAYWPDDDPAPPPTPDEVAPVLAAIRAGGIAA